MEKISKKILIITLLLTLFLLTISTATAADIHMNTTNNTIKNVTETANNGDTIYLDEGTYNHSHLNGTNGIIIDKNITIIGKGADKTIINAQQQGNIFNIQPNGTLTLINLTLTNGTNPYGGAIYNEGSLSVNGSTFTDNTAYNGGAIFNNGGNLTVTGSSFTDNTANVTGAISNTNGNMNINGSTFNNNTANVAGAIYNNLIMTINNSTFTDNNATIGSGGAIFNYGNNTNITNSTFTNNQAQYDGGAIQNQGNYMTINNSAFTNNEAGWGGAINMFYATNITECIFTNNNAIDNGGAIYKNGNYPANIVDSIFIGNTITNDNSSVIDIYGGNISIIGCDFINNTNTILIRDFLNNVIINYNRFVNNTGYDINNSGNNTNNDYNWWGSNNPDMNRIIGTTLNNYFVMNVTNLTSLDSNGTVTFQYTFKLNNTDSFNATLLPYFVTDVYTNITSGIVNIFDARFDNSFDVTVNTSGKILYTFITDNEVQNLEGNAVIPIPPTPPTPTPTPPTPTPTPSPDPVDPVDPDTPDTPQLTNNETSNNPTAKAVMKETGIPINLILLVLLSALGVLVRKQK